jgi:DNA-binding SARP family transcriptional activator
MYCEKSVILELRTFGVPCLIAGDTPLRFPSRKNLALLVVLALEGELRRDRAADLLWTDSATPRDALRNCLGQINRVFKNAGLSPLEATRDRVRWAEPALRVDVRDLERALRSGDLEARLALVGLARGAWLEGFDVGGASEFEDWAAGQGALHVQQLEGLLGQVTEALGALERWDEAILVGERRLKLDALNEGAYRDLVRAQRAAKRDLEARATAGAYRSTVAREIGAKPEVEDWGERLNALGDAEWLLARFVAVAGAHASRRLAQSALGVDALALGAQWARLETLGILEGAGFAHDGARDAVLQRTPTPVRAGLGAVLLAHFESRLGRGEPVSAQTLVHFSVEARDLEREVVHRLRAGKHAYSVGALTAAAAQFERASGLLVNGPLLDVAAAVVRDLAVQLGAVYRALVYTAPNMRVELEQLMGLARERADLGLEAMVHAFVIDAEFAHSRDVTAAELGFTAALALANAARCDTALSTAQLLLAWFENSRWNVAAALEHARVALAIALRSEEALLEFMALEAVYMFEQNLGAWREARGHAVRAAHVALASGHARIGRPFALTMDAFCALQLGAVAEAERTVRGALALLGDGDWHNGLGFAKRTLALALLERDALGEALEAAQTSLAHFQAIEHSFGQCSAHLTLARVHLAGGRAREALEDLERAWHLLAAQDTGRVTLLMRSHALNLRVQALAQLGAPTLTVTLEVLRLRAQDRTPTEATSWLLLCPREDELEALWQAGEHTLARGELEAFLALHPDNPRVAVLHRRARAALHALEGRGQQARVELGRALEEALELGLTMQARVIRARLEASAVLRR